MWNHVIYYMNVLAIANKNYLVYLEWDYSIPFLTYVKLMQN